MKEVSKITGEGIEGKSDEGSRTERNLGNDEKDERLKEDVKEKETSDGV